MRSRLMVLVMLTAVCTAWAQDDEQFLLRYKWTVGQVTTSTMVAETTGTVLVRDLTKDPVEETESPIWSRVTMPMTLTAEDVDADGNATIVYELGVMQMDVEAEGKTQYICVDPKAGTMTVDGEPQDMPEGMLAGMAGPFRIVTTPRGEVVDMELPEGLSGMMRMPGMDMEQWMKMSQGWGATLPEEAIGVGHVWGASVEAPLAVEGEEAPESANDITILYRLLGVRGYGNREVVQIEMLGAMDFETLPIPMLGAMPGTGGDLDVKMGPMHMSVSGTMDFDPEAGELVAFDTTVIMDMTQQMEGTVQTPDGEQQVDMEIITRDMKVNTTVEKVE